MLQIRLTYGKKIILASIAIFILCIADYILTFWGLSINAISEANPMMLSAIRDPILLMIMKILLPVILGVSCWIGRDKVRKKMVTYSLGLVLVVYSMVTLLHIYWIVGLLI